MIKINKYLAKLRRLAPIGQGGQFAFRGQANSKWKLESTVYRRHKTRPSLEEFIKYNCNLVDEAKNANYHQKENKPLEDIEMLAELRHHSAATALIDFTRDFLVALWFACGPKRNSQEGKIFVVDTGDPDNFLQLTSQDKKKPLEKILRFETRDGQNDVAGTDKGLTTTPPGLWYWEPRFEINHRLSSQKGVFIFGKDDIPCQEIPILAKDKETIREELRTWFGINEKSLLNDLPGFATINDTSHRIPVAWTDYFRAGNSYYQQGEWEKALEQYDKIRNSKCTGVYHNRGVAKVRLGRHKEALRDFSKAIDLNPRHAKAYNNRGIAKIALGLPKEALLDFSKVIKRKPQRATVYNNRGVAKAKLGRHKEALRDFSKAIDLNPEYTMAYNNRGSAKIDLGLPKEALLDFDQAIKRNSQYATAYNNRGSAKMAIGLPKEALLDFDQAIALNSEYAMAYNNRGSAKIVLGRFEQALRDFSKAIDQAIALNSEYAMAYNNRGSAKIVLGRFEQALRDFSKAIDLNPQYATAYKRRGTAKVALGLPQEALADFSKAVDLNLQDATAYHFRAQAYATLGDTTAARADFNKALDLATKQANKGLVKLIQEDLKQLPPT